MLSNATWACTDAQHTYPSHAARDSAVNESWSDSVGYCDVPATTENLSKVSSSIFVNPIVKDILQQSQGISTRKHSLVRRQQGKGIGSANIAVQQAISESTDASQNQHDAHAAFKDHACTSEVSLSEATDDSLQHECTPPGISRRRRTGECRNFVLSPLNGNGQHAISEQSKLSSSCDEFNSEVLVSPEIESHRSRHCAAITRGLVQSHRQENDHVFGVAQPCGARVAPTGQGAEYACHPTDTVDAVRSICWKLESFMEQYVATQCHDPHSRHESQRRSDRELVCSPPAASPEVTGRLQEEHDAAGGNGEGPAGKEHVAALNESAPHQNLASQGVHLSITSELAHQGNETEDDALQSAGLHAVVHISRRNAEISVFDGSNDALSTVLVNDTRGQADGAQVLAQHPQVAFCEDRHVGTRCDSDNTSESSGGNPRSRFRAQPSSDSGQRPVRSEHSFAL